MEILEKVEQLKAVLDGLRPLDGEAEARIMQKFRLDWNYHSNNLEGNSLTYGETKALILFGVTAQGKPLKDHFEITGHNEAVNWVLDLVKGDTELTEVFIRQLHTLILKESSYKDAETPDGKPTRRKIEVGKYKTQPNHVITSTGETFYFAMPEETPAKMQELIELFRKEKQKSDVNPILVSSLFHYKFIRIHPFDDGNGRVARILMNFILMQFGYPPVIIKTEDKENYYRALTLADADQMEPFIEYIATNLVRSLEIMIRGARGENIEEPEDLDKELALLDRRLNGLGKKFDVEFTPEVVTQFKLNVLLPLINGLITYGEKFGQFYASRNLTITRNPSTYDNQHSITIPIIQDSKKQLNIEDFTLAMIDNFYYNSGERAVYGIGLDYIFNAFNRIPIENISFESSLEIVLEDRAYVIKDSRNETIITKAYNDDLSDPEILQITNSLAKEHLSFIHERLKMNSSK